MVAIRDGELAGFAVMRACQAASRVGPLFAHSPEIAAALVSAIADKMAAKAVAVDVPDLNKPAMALAESMGLKPSFETARMYTGPVPKLDYVGLHGVTSLELG
jgi:GNAT acetyltransferase-like protein